MKVKKPLFNHTKASCLFCTGKNNKQTTEFSPDWYSYMCVDCMHEHAKRWGHEFEEGEIKKDAGS